MINIKEVQDVKTLDQPKKMKREAYEKELAKLEVDMVKLQGLIKAKGLKVAVIFEGFCQEWAQPSMSWQ